MSLLSKAEIQFLQGQKPVSKSYEYKIKSIIKKKLSVLLNKEIPLLSELFPRLDLSKLTIMEENSGDNLTKNSKVNYSKDNENSDRLTKKGKINFDSRSKKI